MLRNYWAFLQGSSLIIRTRVNFASHLDFCHFKWAQKGSFHSFPFCCTLLIHYCETIPFSPSRVLCSQFLILRILPIIIGKNKVNKANRKQNKNKSKQNRKPFFVNIHVCVLLVLFPWRTLKKTLLTLKQTEVGSHCFGLSSSNKSWIYSCWRSLLTRPKPSYPSVTGLRDQERENRDRE